MSQVFYERNPFKVDDLPWNMNFNGKHLMQENFGWITTYNGRQPLMEHDLWWKSDLLWNTIFNGRLKMTSNGTKPLIKYALCWKKTFNWRLPLMEENLLAKDQTKAKVTFLSFETFPEQSCLKKLLLLFFWTHFIYYRYCY